MTTAYVIVTMIAAVMAGGAAITDALRPPWLLANMNRYGIAEKHLVALGLIKAVGAVGLLAGLAIPGLAAAAALGIVVYFLLATAAVLRAKAYSDTVIPVLFLIPAAGSLALFAVR
ncbi:DoxX family protein [Nocardia sp. NPDC052566]|uniref:DoxX family protein n=1 Tax=Nocardia sp. NPDC052566 TaxID=3364330 RepID=UPI0037C7B2C3